jgi:hypothetical protein
MSHALENFAGASSINEVPFNCVFQSKSDADQRLRKGTVRFRIVGNGNLIISIDDSIAISLKDAAHPDHALTTQLRCAQGAHAGCPINPNAALDQWKNFLWRYGQALEEFAINDCDRPDAGIQLLQIAPPDRREVYRIED